jgi:hypothetical protein
MSPRPAGKTPRIFFLDKPGAVFLGEKPHTVFSMKDANPGLTSDDRNRILTAVQDCLDTIDGKARTPDEAEQRIREQLLRIRAEVSGNGPPN